MPRNNKQNNMQNQKVFTVTAQWAVTIIAGAILTGLVSGAFGAFTAINADHFTVSAHTEQLVEIKENYVRKDVQEQVNNRLEGKIDLLLNRFNLEYKEN